MLRAFWYRAIVILISGVLAQNEQIQLSSTIPDQSADIPLLGFGTWNLDRLNASAVVSTALQAGFRHLDCAAIYGNEKEVGKGIREGLQESGLKREDIWVTSKVS